MAERCGSSLLTTSTPWIPRAAVGRLEDLLYATCAKLLNYPDKAGPAGSQLTAEVAQSLPDALGRRQDLHVHDPPRLSLLATVNQPVTAQTFKDTIERTLNPRMDSYSAQYLADVVGARAYIAGKASHIAGVIATGDTLTIRLLAPAPDFLSRIARAGVLRGPVQHPDRTALRVIPSAGPYYVASYTPGQGVVLARNPNYHGSRPHHFARIAARGRDPRPARVRRDRGRHRRLHGSVVGFLHHARRARRALAARYGPGSAAAAARTAAVLRQPGAPARLLLPEHPPAAVQRRRVRQAVNYAINRRALARLGDSFQPLPERPTDHYLPPGMPGYRDAHVYPTTPNLAKARAARQGGARRRANRRPLHL